LKEIEDIFLLKCNLFFLIFLISFYVIL